MWGATQCIRIKLIGILMNAGAAKFIEKGKKKVCDSEGQQLLCCASSFNKFNSKAQPPDDVNNAARGLL